VATISALHSNDLFESLNFARTQSAPRSQAFIPAEHAKAMAARLAQLQAAMGNGEVDEPGEISSAPASAPAVRQFGFRSLVLVGLTSAALGGATTWLIKSGDAPAMPSPPSMVSPSVRPPSRAVQVAAPIAPTTAPTLTDEMHITELLETWREAWSKHNVANYLNVYGMQFTPADGSARDTWVATRTKKLATKTDIAVQIHDVVIERISTDLFKVTFQQDYSSGNYREVGRTKNLQIAREGNDWKIIREQQD
jgi:hypothetical protein